MRVVWVALAIERAYEAASFIAADKPEAALRWLDGLFHTVDRLELFPESGRVVPEIGQREYREIVYGHSYRVVYLIEKNRILVLTVRNCARRLDLAEVVPIRRK